MKIKAVFVAVLLCSAALFAQQRPSDRGPRAGFQTDQLKAFLGLSDEQLTNLTSIQNSFRSAAGPITRQIAEKSRALREALKQNPVDATLVTQLKADITSLQTQEESLRAQYRGQAQTVLSFQQKDKLATLQQALQLVPVAHQAAFLNLLDFQQGYRRGPGGPPSPGSRAPRGFGPGTPPKP